MNKTAKPDEVSAKDASLEERQAREDVRLSHTAYMRRWRLLRRQAGLCTQCGHPKDSVPIHPEKESEKRERLNASEIIERARRSNEPSVPWEQVKVSLPEGESR